MPSPSSIIKNYHIKRGVKLHGYVLHSFKIDHIILEKFHEYEYPLVLVFEPIESEQSSITKLKKEIIDNLTTHKVIPTRWKNDYECYFDKIKFETEPMRIVVRALGHGFRLYN